MLRFFNSHIQKLGCSLMANRSLHMKPLFLPITAENTSSKLNNNSVNICNQFTYLRMHENDKSAAIQAVYEATNDLKQNKGYGAYVLRDGTNPIRISRHVVGAAACAVHMDENLLVCYLPYKSNTYAPPYHVIYEGLRSGNISTTANRQSILHSCTAKHHISTLPSYVEDLTAEEHHHLLSQVLLIKRKYCLIIVDRLQNPVLNEREDHVVQAQLQFLHQQYAGRIALVEVISNMQVLAANIRRTYVPSNSLKYAKVNSNFIVVNNVERELKEQREAKQSRAARNAEDEAERLDMEQQWTASR